MKEKKTNFKKDLFRGVVCKEDNSKTAGITLIALAITIIILLIIAGITVAQLTNSGLFGKSQEAKEKWDNAQNDENEKISKYENEIATYVDGNREIADEEINNKIKNILDSYYQKLRSDTYEEVTFLNEGRFTAPCDGYYCYASSVYNIDSNILSYCDHYTANNVFIGRHPAGGFRYTNEGAEIYMKKGEYINFINEGNVTINYSRFFYAVGCQPDENE